MLCTTTTKPPLTSKFYVDFKNFFFQTSKKCHTFLSSNVLRLVRSIFELKHSRFQPFYRLRTRKPRWLRFFLHSCASSSFKDAAPKVLWKKVISSRSKELKSDPGSCPLDERLNTGMAPTCNWRIKIVII